MSTLLNLVKKTSLVKKIRKNKWRRYAQRWMFNPNEVIQLTKHPEKIEKAVRHHISKHMQDLNGIDETINRALRRSGIMDYYKGDEKDLKLDILFWTLAYGFTVNEYLCYRFISKNRNERLEFMSDRDSVLLGYQLNDIDDMSIFSDKSITYQVFGKYYGREAITIETRDDYRTFAAFIKKHTRFIKKDVYQSCGRGIEIIDLTESKKSDDELFSDILSEGKTILEELIVQDEVTGVFNVSSVNTIRCITLNADNVVQTPFCFMKIGRKGEFIDNGAAGGILVGIDEKTGILNSDGVDEYGIRYEFHPDSGVRFKGYQLSEWHRMVKLCIELAAMVPDMRWIGWDMAYTSTGWIVVEGNPLTEVIGPQSTRLAGIRRKLSKIVESI